MHRQVCDSPSSIDWSNLPSTSPGAKLRLLVLSTEALGGKTYNRQLEFYTAARDDIDVVHVRAHPTLPLRLAARAGVNPATYWAMTLRRTFSRLARHFDAVHATRQATALVAARQRREGTFTLSCTADSTVPVYAAEFGDSAKPCPIEREIFTACDLISPYSRWVADSLRRDYAVSSERVHVLPPAPPPAYRQREVPVRDHAKPRILFVGNDHIRKGLPSLLRWHQQRWCDRAELHVVSDRATAEPQMKNVIWHGGVAYDRIMREIMPAADIFVLPTRLDTYGQVFVEAMVCGVPAIGTRQAAIPEIIEDGVTGFTCPEGFDADFIAAVEHLLDNPGLRLQMAEAALTRAADRFDSDRNYNVFLDRLKAEAFERNGK